MRPFLLFVFLCLGSKLFAQHPSVDSLGRIAKAWSIKKQNFDRDTNLIFALYDQFIYKNYFREKDSKSLLDSLERLTNRTNWIAGKGLVMLAKCNYVNVFEQDKGSKAINLALKGYEILEKQKNPRALYHSNFRLAAIMLWNVNATEKEKIDGLNYAKKAVKYARIAKDTSLICSGLAYTANQLFGFGKPKYKEAEQLLLEGESLIKKSKVSYFAENLIYGTLAGLYSDLNSPSKTLEYIEKTLISGKRENDLYSIGSMLQFKAYMIASTGKLNDIKKAIPIYEESYKYAKEQNDINVMARVEEKLYGSFRLIGETKKALEYLELLINHQKKIDQKNIQKVYADFDISSKELKIKELENQQLIKDKALKILENQSLLKDRDAKINELNFLKLLKINSDSLAAQKEQKFLADIQIKGNENKIKSLENDRLQKANERISLFRNILISSLLVGIGLIIYVFANNKKLRSKNEELIQKNNEIEGALLKGQVIERKRVASELHDNLSAKISGIKWRLEAIKPSFETEKQQNIYTSSINALAEVYTDVRLISHNLLPAELETKGLKHALVNLVSEINGLEKTQFHLNISETENRYKSKIEYELFSIILELSNNILKHSKAEKALISLEKFENILKLTVADNGIGFNELETKKGMGFANLKSRVDSLNGKMLVENNGGVNVKIEVPIG